MDLFLFTNFFPYKKSEPFLQNEFVFTKDHFQSITILSLYGDKKDASVKETPTLSLLTPPLNSPSNKKSIFFKGLFNRASFGPHLNDFFLKVIFSPKKWYYFFISLFITRLTISSEGFKQLINKVNRSEQPLLYFYWSDNLAWLIPYLNKTITNPKAKIIMRSHGSDLFEYVKGNYAPLREAIFESTHHILPVSQAGSDYLIQKYPAHKNKIKTSYLGVFDNGLNPATGNGPLIIVSASNMVALKRIDLIFEILQKANREVIWHHFGSGSLLSELTEIFKNKREKLTIKLHGQVENKELIQFYKSNAVDLFINTSSSEGLPVTIMEALSFGIPVIATNVGGVSELVNDHNGYLIHRDFKPEVVSEYIHNFKFNPLKRQAARLTFEQKVNAEVNYRNFYNLITTNDQ